MSSIVDIPAAATNIERAIPDVDPNCDDRCVIENCDESRPDLDYNRCREAQIFSCESINDCEPAPPNEESVNPLAGRLLVQRAIGSTKIKFKAEGTLSPTDARPLNGEDLKNAEIVLCGNHGNAVTLELSTGAVLANKDGKVRDIGMTDANSRVSARWILPNNPDKEQVLRIKGRTKLESSAVDFLPTDHAAVILKIGDRDSKIDRRVFCMEFEGGERRTRKYTSDSSLKPVDCTEETLRCNTEVVEP